MQSANTFNPCALALAATGNFIIWSFSLTDRIVDVKSKKFAWSEKIIPIQAIEAECTW
jgi:hypothetical protein